MKWTPTDPRKNDNSFWAGLTQIKLYKYHGIYMVLLDTSPFKSLGNKYFYFTKTK